MKIVVLNGSPHENGNTSFLVDAFARGARTAGHDVNVIPVGRMHINPYDGAGSEADDAPGVYEAMRGADMVVIASPIYYFMLTAGIVALIQRMHGQDLAGTFGRTALILSSGSDGVYDMAVDLYTAVFPRYMKTQDMGIITVHGAQNKSAAAAQEMERFAQSLA